MRTWTRSAIRRECGRGRHVILPNEPALRLTFAAPASAVLWRCVECEGPAPEDIPPLVVDARPAMADRIRQLLAATSHDWKRSQAGDE
jgi:hypothetical protein